MTRSLHLLALTACLLLALPALAQRPSTAAAETFVHDLPALLTAAPQFAQLESQVRTRVAGVSGVTVESQTGSSPSLQIGFATPLNASRVATLLGIAHPVAISGDVHQTEWFLASRTATIHDPYQNRIATQTPAFGTWMARAVLVGRPAGPLPTVVAGASPAYDLQLYSASVRSIEIEASR